ncbi:MAG: phosphoserine phosphatase SerB [Pelagibacteraceae bacterium]|nr:phosphoserine phosphatase SerB [Pelagibacteraceae bacterium]MBT5214840.1 phosphoserine phosphatase SerB [Pelagibacteraceae bacterium]MBT6355162.1 phosphoserine phosphatase SerB [Pelagibacteraceae bacterium]
MKNDKLVVLTFVLDEVDKINYNNVSKIIKNFLHSSDIKVNKIKVLKTNKASDFFFTDKFNNFNLNNLKKRLPKIKVDFCFQDSSQRKKKILMTDMDGTIIENETLNDIANFLGKGEQVKKITELGLRGRLDFSTSLENRVQLLKGLRLSSLEEAKRIVTFMKGAKKLFKTLKNNKITTILVSGGFKPITTYVKNYLKIDYEYSNTFGITGDLFDGTSIKPIVNANFKEKLVLKIIKEFNLNKNQIVGIGDAANDMNMLFSVGLPIAYKAQDIVKANFDNQINNTDLSTVLYFMGISD